MQRNAGRDTASRAQHTIARSTINEANDDTEAQEMKADFWNNDKREKVERIQNYGFTSVPLPRDKEGGGGSQVDGGEKQGGPAAEAVVVYQGGQRNHPVIVAVEDRRHRPRGLKPGENAQYDDQGQMNYLAREGNFLVSPKLVSMRHAKKDKQGKGKDGKGYAHEGKSGDVTAEIVISEGNIKFLINGVVMGEVSDAGFVIGGAHSDPKKRQVFRKDDIDDAGNKPELYAKRAWGV